MNENSNDNIHENTSMYLMVNAVAARVKALMRGSTPLVQIESNNLLDIAYEEIQRGLVNITASIPEKPEPTDEDLKPDPEEESVNKAKDTIPDTDV